MSTPAPIKWWWFLAVIMAFAGPACLGGNWPQFRGPNGSGVDSGAAAPITWNLETGENIRWKVAIPGLANSSPIIWQNRLYVTTATKDGPPAMDAEAYGNAGSIDEPVGHHWRLLCLEKATGKLKWDRPGLETVPRFGRHPRSTQCNSTPATDGRHIVAMFGDEALVCFDMQGRQRWRKDLALADSGFYGAATQQWGFASSPLIHGDRVLLQCDVRTNSFLAAFALRDGREIWRTPRVEVPGWSTPVMATNAGHAQVIVAGYHHNGGYDWTSGREVWRLSGGGVLPIPSPVVAHGLVFLTSATGGFSPLTAVRLDATGDITPARTGLTNAHIRWSYPHSGNYIPSPIVVDGRLYCGNDSGILTCYDARTGQNVCKERLGTGGDGFYASPVAVGGRIYFTSEAGKVYVVSAGSTFSPVATNSIGDTCRVSPAISDGVIFFRTHGELLAVGAKSSKGKTMRPRRVLRRQKRGHRQTRAPNIHRWAKRATKPMDRKVSAEALAALQPFENVGRKEGSTEND